MTDFANPHFAEPQWLWLAVAVPVLLLALHRHAARARRRDLAAIASPQLIGELTRSHSPGRRMVKHALLLLAAAGIGVALARPQWGVQESAAQELGEDIVFAVDCSRSMLAADVSPNRLARAKLAVLEFARQHGAGRVGLVAFSGQAFLLCPLTFDHDAFADALRALDDKTISVPGTDLGRALDESFRAMEKLDRRKVVVLLTDGEDLEQTGPRVAESLAGRGVVVFAVGVGTATGAEIQVPNEQGLPELVRDPQGEPVRSRLDEATLRAIAQATRGNYFPLGSLGEGVAKVRLALEGNVFSGRAGKVQKLGVDRFHVPVAIVLILLVAESLIGTRRRKGARL
jgi:Ca-activated chloride channel homolog